MQAQHVEELKLRLVTRSKGCSGLGGMSLVGIDACVFLGACQAGGSASFIVRLHKRLDSNERAEHMVPSRHFGKR